jgi:hypothetical protein
MEEPRNVTSEAVPREHSTQQHAKQFSHKDVNDSNRSYDHLTIMMPPKECINLKCWEHRYSEKSVVAIELIKCGRSFAPDVYEKHFDSNGHSTCANDVGKDQCVFNSAKACSLTIPI